MTNGSSGVLADQIRRQFVEEGVSKAFYEYTKYLLEQDQGLQDKFRERLVGILTEFMNDLENEDWKVKMKERVKDEVEADVRRVIEHAIREEFR